MVGVGRNVVRGALARSGKNRYGGGVRTEDSRHSLLERKKTCRGTMSYATTLARSSPNVSSGPKSTALGPVSVSYVPKSNDMAITKAKKEDIVAKVADALSNAASVVFVHFKGLSVTDTSAMRRELKKEGVGYFVAKKTLLRRALSEKGYEGTLPELPGEIAIAWTDADATAAARGIHEHGKKHKDALSIVGGVFENKYLDAAGMNAIATIPPVPVLRGMFVNVINSPIQGLVIALDKVREKKAA